MLYASLTLQEERVDTDMTPQTAWPQPCWSVQAEKLAVPFPHFSFCLAACSSPFGVLLLASYAATVQCGPSKEGIGLFQRFG